MRIMRSTSFGSLMSAVVELQGLGVHLGRRQILHGLTGSLSGRAIGLLGPNGAGKTTLLHTLLGFYPVSSGTAKLGARVVMTNVPGDFLRPSLPLGMGVRFENIPPKVRHALTVWAHKRLTSLGF